MSLTRLDVFNCVDLNEVRAVIGTPDPYDGFSLLRFYLKNDQNVIDVSDGNDIERMIAKVLPKSHDPWPTPAAGTRGLAFVTRGCWIELQGIVRVQYHPDPKVPPGPGKVEIKFTNSSGDSRDSVTFPESWTCKWSDVRDRLGLA
jgi:hypothetical protein